MTSPTNYTIWNGDGNKYNGDNVVGLSQPQAHGLSHDSFVEDWRWDVDARQTSMCAWNAALHPNARPMATVNSPTSTPSQHHSPQHPSAFLMPQTGYAPSGGQATYDRKTYKGEHHRRNHEPHPHVGSQTTTKKIRKVQQSLGRPQPQPLRCEWNGCAYSGSFKRESLLIRHLKKLHFYPGSHPCPIEDCDMVCNRKDNLMQHMRNIHC